MISRRKMERILLATDFLRSFAVRPRAGLSTCYARERSQACSASVRSREGLAMDRAMSDTRHIESDTNSTGNSEVALVLGVHGNHHGVGHLLIGSNTEKLLLTVSCPTPSIGAHVLGGVDLSLKLKEILYCSDFTPEAAVAAGACQ